MFLELYYLIFWPEEESYSEVGQAKIVEPKKPSTGDTVKVKVGTKVHTGKVVGSGTKTEVEKMMSDIEVQQSHGEEQHDEAGTQEGGKEW